MPKTSLQDFVESIQKQFPNLKSHDETRLFADLLRSGVNFEFEFDSSGNTMVAYDDIGEDMKKKLSQQ